MRGADYHGRVVGDVVMVISPATEFWPEQVFQTKIIAFATNRVITGLGTFVRGNFKRHCRKYKWVVDRKDKFFLDANSTMYFGRGPLRRGLVQG
jgi:hypothetical protein